MGGVALRPCGRKSRETAMKTDKTNVTTVPSPKEAAAIGEFSNAILRAFDAVPVGTFQQNKPAGAPSPRSAKTGFPG